MAWIMLEHPRIHYFTKAIKTNRPLTLPKCNIMTIHDLELASSLCDHFPFGSIFRAVFLLAFFTFLRISNLAPHSIAQYDPGVRYPNYIHICHVQ